MPLRSPASKAAVNGSVAAAARTIRATEAATSSLPAERVAERIQRASAADPPASAARKSGWKNPKETYVSGVLSQPSQAAVAAAVIVAGTARVRAIARTTERA